MALGPRAGTGTSVASCLTWIPHPTLCFWGGAAPVGTQGPHHMQLMLLLLHLLGDSPEASSLENACSCRGCHNRRKEGLGGGGRAGARPRSPEGQP